MRGLSRSPASDFGGKSVTPQQISEALSKGGFGEFLAKGSSPIVSRDLLADASMDAGCDTALDLK